MNTLRTIAAFAGTLIIAMVILALASSASADDEDWFGAAVDTNPCEVELHPSGRTLWYVDSVGRSGGPLDKPDTATLAFPDGGWIDVTLGRVAGGQTKTQRFDVPGPCDETTTTGGTSSTTQPETTTSTPTTSTVPPSTTTLPETTTTLPVTTTTVESTTTTSGGTSTTTSTLPTSSSTTSKPTPTTTVLTVTTAPETTTSSSTSTSTTNPGTTTSSPTVTTMPTTSSTLPNSSTVPATTPTTTPPAELPNTGIDSAIIALVGLGLLSLGGAAVIGARRAT